MTNRFDTSQQYQYQSQHIPLPFEYIAALGEKTNQKFEHGKALENELGVLGSAIKAAPMYEGHRQKYINEYNSKINELVDEAKGDYGSPEFQRKSQRLIQEFKSRPEINAFANTLKSYQDWESQMKNPDTAMNLDYTYGKDNEGNFRQLDVVKEGVYTPKFTKYEDWNKTGKDVMGKIADSGMTKEYGLDPQDVRINNGETEVWSRKTNSYIGVSDPRVKQLSSLMAGEYANTVAGKHHMQSLLKPYIGEAAYNLDYNTLSRKAQSGDEQAQNIKNNIDKEFANHLYRANANQIGSKTTSTISDHFVTNRDKVAKNDRENIDRALIGQPIEGLTFDLTKDDKEFNDLKDSDVYKLGSDGTLKIDWTNLKTNKPVYYNSKGERTSQAVDSEGVQNTKVEHTSTEKYNKLNSHIRKIADAIGYQGAIKADNYDDILGKYNAYSKVRMYDEQMTAPVSKVESAKALRNWNNYDIMDIDNPDKPLEEKPILEKGDQLILNNFRNTPEGKMNRDGFIRRADGTIEPILIRPKTVIDDGYHNKISEINQRAAKYEVGQVTPKGKTTDGFDIVNTANIANVGRIETLGYTNQANDGRKTTIFKVTPEDGSQPIAFKTQAALQQYLNMKYYGTDAGFADRYSIAPPKTSFEGTGVPENTEEQP